MQTDHINSLITTYEQATGYKMHYAGIWWAVSKTARKPEIPAKWYHIYKN